MTLEEFTQSLEQKRPPADCQPLLQALWHEAKDRWDEAHKITQEIDTTDGSWVHAYLHRKEGDSGNARYWYSRAGRQAPTLSLQQEWQQIAAALLADS
jgi:hypothetical protein